MKSYYPPQDEIAVIDAYKYISPERVNELIALANMGYPANAVIGAIRETVHAMQTQVRIEARRIDEPATQRPTGRITKSAFAWAVSAPFTVASIPSTWSTDSALVLNRAFGETVRVSNTTSHLELLVQNAELEEFVKFWETLVKAPCEMRIANNSTMHLRRKAAP